MTTTYAALQDMDGLGRTDGRFELTGFVDVSAAKKAITVAMVPVRELLAIAGP